MVQTQTDNKINIHLAVYTLSYTHVHKKQRHTSLLCFVHSLGLPLLLVAKQETEDNEDDQEAE